MLKQPFVCLAMLCALSFGANAEITSIGDWACQKWQNRRTSGTRVDTPQMWLSGYLTGLASAYRKDVLAITTAPSIFIWMDAYCEAYPGESVSTGALLLFKDLSVKLARVSPQKSTFSRF